MSYNYGMSQFRRAWLHVVLNVCLECESILFKLVDKVRARRRKVVWMLGKHYKLTDKYKYANTNSALESDEGELRKDE